MRRLLIAAWILLSGLSASHAAIALVQSTGNALSASGPIVSSTFNVAPTIGNIMVAFVSASNSAGVNMAGWNALTSVGAGSGSSQRSVRIFWRVVVASHPAWGQNDAGANAARAIFMAEFSGIDSAAALLAEGAQETVSGTSHDTPSVAPGDGVNALAITGYMVRALSTWSGQALTGSLASTEMDDRQSVTINASSFCYNDITSTSGSYAGNGTSSGSSVGGAAIAIFKASAGGGGDPDLSVPLIDRIPPNPVIIGL